jgi:alpha-L-arabinofuranosidase
LLRIAEGARSLLHFESGEVTLGGSAGAPPGGFYLQMNRRSFLRNSTLGAAYAFAPRMLSETNGAVARIDVLFDEPLGVISPNIYGHFTENLGGVVYDGIWVGRDSKVANVGGIRKSLVEALREIHSPVIRWPGGCFADSYDWHDGIGPADKRPRRTNFWADDPQARGQGNVPQKFDPNQFGTDEFVQFCRLAGSEPYIAGNVRGLSVMDFDRWVEYCNSPAGSTTLADQRAADGNREPFNVRYWGIGNEQWGCGGNFTPAEYAAEFRRILAYVPRYGLDLSFIASGPNVDDWNWTRGFLQALAKKGPDQLLSVYGLSLHYYSWNLSRGRTEDWIAGKGDALKFDPVDWYELLIQGQRLEALIEGHWQVMSEVDPAHHVKLIVDEWGPWYRPGSEARPTDYLGQMITLRDAVFSAISLDIFNRHPEKVAMANCAQMINCLNSLFIAHDDKLVLTPVYHVFKMYRSHQGGQALRSVFSGPDLQYQRDGKLATIWNLKGSASLRDRMLTLTVVNPSVEQLCQAEICLYGANVGNGEVSTLTHSDIHAHNSFDAPTVVTTETKKVEFSGQTLRWTFPARSVTAFRISLV